MRILSWNIMQGGGTRVNDVVSAIASHTPNVVVLNEVSAARQGELHAALHARGFTHRIDSGPTGRAYGSLVASHQPIEPLPRAQPCEILPHGLLEARVPSLDVTLGVVYGPIPLKAVRFHDFWFALIEHAKSRLPHPYLLVGDFNTGEGMVDAHRNMLGSRHFLAVRELGYTDAWRVANADAREYTWFSRRAGRDLNGFRIDHALASPPLACRLGACRYSHAERESRISDHSILIVDCDADRPVRGKGIRARKR